MELTWEELAFPLESRNRVRRVAHAFHIMEVGMTKMVGHVRCVYAWDTKKQLYSGNGPFPDTFISVPTKHLFVTISLRDASFFISISNCHCLHSFGRTAHQTQNRMREALEIIYVYRDLANH